MKRKKNLNKNKKVFKIEKVNKIIINNNQQLDKKFKILKVNNKKTTSHLLMNQTKNSAMEKFNQKEEIEELQNNLVEINKPWI